MEINLNYEIGRDVKIHYFELGEPKIERGVVAHNYNNGYYDVELMNGNIKQIRAEDIYPLAQREAIINETPSSDSDTEEDEVASVDERVYTSSEVMEIIKKALEV